MQNEPLKTNEVTENIQPEVKPDIQVVPNDVKKPFWIGIFKPVLDFLNKFKWIILAVLAILIAVIVFLYNFIGVISVNNDKLVNLDTTVRIEKGQIIKTKGQDVLVEISNFANETCPTGKKCFGSNAKSVEYQVTVDGKKYATGSVSKIATSEYNIETVDSDYQTYANIKITKIK